MKSKDSGYIPLQRMNGGLINGYELSQDQEAVKIMTT